MRKVQAILEPHELEPVRRALATIHVVGMTVTEVRGISRHEGHRERYRSTEYTVDLLPKVALEVVAEEGQAERVAQQIRQTLHAGGTGAGRIFLEPVEEVFRIRTGERGVGALS